MRINRYLVALVVVVTAFALFIDGYAYVWRAYHHLGFSQPLPTPPTLFHRQVYLPKGLDLQGGTEIVLEIDPRSLPPGTKLSDAQASTVQVMEKRVNGLGVSESQVQSQGDRRVVIQLPGVDFDRATAVIGRTAKLTLNTWKVVQVPANGKLAIPLDATGAPVVDPKQVPASEGGTCVGGTDALPCIPLNALPVATGIDGSMITGASTGIDQTNQPTVDFQLNDRGATLLADVTKDMTSKPTPTDQLAIFLDNNLINSAHVQTALNTGQVQISGGNISTNATYRTDLANTLKAGRLPGKVSIVEANSVGATLGFDSVRRALEAGALGLTVVVLFMVLYYRLPGVVASLALMIYAAITLAVFKLIPITMTLAGLAGFVLSVGMAVDANVLIFERLREELRNGRSLAAASEAAITRAFPAIRDSNISTLITCGVLYFHDRFLPIGFTLAKGFALTLGFGVMVSFFSAVIVTHTLLVGLVRIRGLRRPGLYAVEKMQ
ncbi:MAG: protein translocase subunit SecD [Candidatus Dormibacteria bacterium]